jgi:type II secretory pathway component PulK
MTPFRARVLAEPALHRTDHERGFALLTVLWLITALSAVVGVGLATTRLGQRTTLNRVALARGLWAAEGCLAIVQARWVQHRLTDAATIDLGRGMRCDWRIEDPTARVNVNTAEREVLERVTRDADSIVARRRESALADLDELPDLDPTLVTIDGPGTVNLSAAPRQVLLALPGLSAEAVDRLLTRRAVGRPVGSLDELAGLLSPGGRVALLARYADLARLATFAAPQLKITVQGSVRGEPPRATIAILVVPLPERLAVIRRQMW